jgi:hypothetical protein
LLALAFLDFVEGLGRVCGWGQDCEREV